MNPEISDDIVDMLKKMLNFDHQNIISGLSHPYFLELETNDKLSLSTSTSAISTNVSLSDTSMSSL
jgi:hypothetical protein